MAVIPIRLRGGHFILLNAATGLANVVVLSNVPGYTILTPYVAGNLQGVTQSFAGWATTDHMIGLALGFPIARWLAARYGDYRVYGTALAAYAFFSFLCASSDTIWSFVPMRLLLGLTGGVILPVGQAILLGEYPPERRTLGVGIWGVLSMMPFTIGVFMGGVWAEFFGWRAMFLSNVVIALTVAGITGSLFYGRRIKRHIARFDGVGFFLLAVIFLCLQTIFNQGNDFDWFASPILAGALVVVIVAITLLLHLGTGRTPSCNRREAFSSPQLCDRSDLLCCRISCYSRTIVGLRRAAPTVAWIFVLARGHRLSNDDPSFRAACRHHS